MAPNRAEAVLKKLGFAMLASGVFATAGGCASGPKFKSLGPAEYVFTVVFENGCPKKVAVDFKNCLDGAADCVYARRGDTVTFVSSTPSNDFSIRFDPFKKGAISSRGGRISEVLDSPRGKSGKVYTFSVLSDPPDKCPALDPQIILD
jgi:hypothetical protein